MFRRMRGFTLMELLVVIAIIGILMTLVLGAIMVGKYKARDTKRIADLRSIGTALELYRIDTGHYPVALNWVTDCGHSGNNWIPDGTNYDWADKYQAVMPRDPTQSCTQAPLRTYQYWSDGNKYQVTAQLESPTAPQGSGLAFDGFSFVPLVGQPIIATLSSTASDPTAQSPIPFTISFSQSVVDFTQASLTVLRGFVSGLVAVSDAVYNFFITPTDNDVITVTLSANRVHDANGATNQSTQYSITYDSLKPHLALSPDPLPTPETGAFTVSLNSTIAITDFSNASVVVTNGTVSGAQAVAPMDGRNFTFVVTPSSSGTVTVSIPADSVHSSAGFGNVASNQLSTTYTP